MKKNKNTIKLSFAIIALLLAGCSSNSTTTSGNSVSDNTATSEISSGDSKSDNSSNSDTSSGDSKSDNSSNSDTSQKDDDNYNGYYSSISSIDSGSSLLKKLNALNNSKRTKKVGYDGLRTAYKDIDVDWTGKEGKGKVIGFYDNAQLGPSWDSGATWNREHVWPKSKGGGKVDDDAYMPRPTSTKINSSRGNSAYAASGAYDPGQEGIKNYRGISARIIFYCAIADTSLSIVDSTNIGTTQMGKLSDLLKWNLEYLPSSSADAALELRVEHNRNEVIQSKYQGNRNPFVDHPEYACKIWGSTNSTTKQICGL